MKMSIKFDMNGIEVFQDIEIHGDYTDQDIIKGLGRGDILTGINSGAFIIDISNGFKAFNKIGKGFNKIGKVLTTEFEHDIPYTEFELVS